MSLLQAAYSGCYEAPRAAALSGVPLRTVYRWAANGVVAPSISPIREKLWSYADLMGLRIVYWLRQPRRFGDQPQGLRMPPDEEVGRAPARIDRLPGSLERQPTSQSDEQRRGASTMAEVRQALRLLEAQGLDIWKADSTVGGQSPLRVDRGGKIYVVGPFGTMDSRGQQLLGDDWLDLLGPWTTAAGLAPDLIRPRPHLRIVPGKVAGEPHVEHTRLTTRALFALHQRGFSLEAISVLYPDESPSAIVEAIDLERQLARLLQAA